LTTKSPSFPLTASHVLQGYFDEPLSNKLQGIIK
jgi:hypothetical protein